MKQMYCQAKAMTTEEYEEKYDSLCDKLAIVKECREIIKKCKYKGSR